MPALASAAGKLDGRGWSGSRIVPCAVGQQQGTLAIAASTPTVCSVTWASHGYERYLLQIGVVVFSIRLALTGCNLLNGGSRRQQGAKILGVDAVKRRLVRQIVEIDIRGDDLVKLHLSFFEVVQQVPHGLPQLMLRSRRIDAAVRPRNKAALGGAI